MWKEVVVVFIQFSFIKKSAFSWTEKKKTTEKIKMSRSGNYRKWVKSRDIYIIELKVMSRLKGREVEPALTLCLFKSLIVC